MKLNHNELNFIRVVLCTGFVLLFVFMIVDVLTGSDSTG